MQRTLVLLFATAAVISRAYGASLLEQQIDQAIRTSRVADSAAVGIEVLQAATGKILYSQNADKLFTPASNTKLFTTALALMRLGADYRIPTRIFAAQAPDASGRVDGGLVLAGYGDPSMSFLAIPYSKDAAAADPLAAIEHLADDIAARGIRSIHGDITGDDTVFPAEPFPPGWAIDDATWEYGAPVSALCLGSNFIKVKLAPGGREGDAAAIEITPPLEYFVIDNRVRTSAATGSPIHARRLGIRELELSGVVSIKDGPAELALAVDDPALFAAIALQDALARRGIAISGRPAARHRYDSTPPAQASLTLLAERSSPPLLELLRVVDKVSQNLWAELMLRQVALARTGDGSLMAGLEELKTFLTEIGVAPDDTAFQDGSGLSRATLVKPAAVVQLLRYMYASPNRDAWIALLPVGGEDGTLEKRFARVPAAKSIRAKTGSLSHVQTLSGYADSATYGELVFSIMVNSANAPASDVRDFIDKIGMTLLE